MRKGIVALVITLAAIGWAVVLFDPGRPLPAPARPFEPEPQVVLPPAAEPVPRPQRPEPSAVAGPAAETGQPPSWEPAPVVPRDLPEEERRRRLLEIAREQRRLNDARIVVAEARWQEETRKPGWAEPQERALQRALVRDGIDAMLMDLECRETLCRIELAAIDSNAAFALKRGEQFAGEVGLQQATRMQGGGLDRVLVLYSARDQSSLDP